MARTVDDIQRWLQAVCQSAANVGLEMHWGKLQLLRVRCDGIVRAPTGEAIEAKDSLSYLGTTNQQRDGRASGEITRRIGMAFAAFRSMKQLWGHTSISLDRKVELFN
eukprot:157888-Pyramimonas_sp.AAC.1